jgi:hypothetical protein
LATNTARIINNQRNIRVEYRTGRAAVTIMNDINLLYISPSTTRDEKEVDVNINSRTKRSLFKIDWQAFMSFKISVGECKSNKELAASHNWFIGHFKRVKFLIENRSIY